ncbi:hypothetical protein QT972_16575 [Microcoleus sp. herbarium7]|uniref:recombination directionality factor n=1 Tax=Microcoleus sp. herbarium7 TaxID=3055435 RepID=UPI002FCF144F
MPIHGKTDLETLDFRVPQTPIKVYKGDVKGGNTPGKNLKTKLRIHIETHWLRDQVQATIDELREEIPIYLAHSHPDQTFPNYNKEFSLSGLETVCDGINILQRSVAIEGTKGLYRKLIDVQDALPCAKGDSPECPKGCKGTGTLYFYLQELQQTMPHQMASLTTVHSTEVPTIAKLLLNYWREFGSLTASPFPSPSTYGRIPFVLRRLEGKGKKPTFDGNKMRTGKFRDDPDWPVTLTVDPIWYERFLLYQQWLEAKKHNLQLPSQVLQQLGFGEQVVLKSAEATPQLAAAKSGEEEVRLYLFKKLGEKLKADDRSKEWAKEVAFKRYGVTGARDLTIEQLEAFLNFLSIPDQVEQYVESYAHNYQEEIDALVTNIDVTATAVSNEEHTDF